MPCPKIPTSFFFFFYTGTLENTLPFRLRGQPLAEWFARFPAGFEADASRKTPLESMHLPRNMQMLEPPPPPGPSLGRFGGLFRLDKKMRDERKRGCVVWLEH